MTKRQFNGMIVIDDIKPEVAASAETRAKVRHWFDKMIKSRLMHDSGNTIHIISRLHPADSQMDGNIGGTGTLV